VGGDGGRTWPQGWGKQGRAGQAVATSILLLLLDAREDWIISRQRRRKIVGWVCGIVVSGLCEWVLCDKETRHGRRRKDRQSQVSGVFWTLSLWVRRQWHGLKKAGTNYCIPCSGY